MKKTNYKRRIVPLAALSVVVSLGALLSASPVYALSSYLTEFSTTYPGSTSEDNASCQTCHASSTQNLNPYGEALCVSGAGSIINRFADVELMNSDVDPTGSDNLTEINAGTQPGWTPGNVNPTYSRGNCSPTGLTEAPPTFIPGNLDPAVANQPPVANANGPYNGTVNIPLSFDGSASSDPDGTIVSYAWDFGDGNTGTGVSPTHTYITDGVFNAALTVTDDVGDTGTDTSTATIGLGNQPPVSDPNGPYTGTVGVAVAFDGSASADPDGTITSYSWNFGDGNTGTGATPSHTYAVAGMYNVILTVTDDVGATDAAGTTADVTNPPTNQPPVADPGGPYSGSVGVPVAFDGTASADPDGTITAYDWDFGDGNLGSGATPTHTYAVDGNYTVTLTVTDDASATGTATTTASIGVVGNQPPVADPNGPYSGTIGVPVAFDGTASSDPDGTITAYNWDFGDGSTGTGATPTHTYAADGNYTVTLTVTDDAGDTGTATSSATIGVGNLPPVADPNGPYSGTVGAPVTFDGTGSTDPDGTIGSYSWDFGDGNTGTGATPSHAYTSAGTYNVTLTVTDDAGATDSAMTTATIAPVSTGADVFLTNLKVKDKVEGKQGKTKSTKVKVKGDGDTIAQDATVTLSVMSPAGVTVTVNPTSMTKVVSPDDGDSTKFSFKADITCDVPGSYTLKWTATITAAQNSDPSNDTLTDTTSVRCKMAEDDDDDSKDDDDEKEGHDD